MASPTDEPVCRRCSGSHTRFFRHLYPGGFHIGAWCMSCDMKAQTDRTWYARSAFSDDEVAAMPTRDEFERTSDSRQRELF